MIIIPKCELHGQLSSSSSLLFLELVVRVFIFVQTHCHSLMHFKAGRLKFALKVNKMLLLLEAQVCEEKKGVGLSLIHI